MMSSDPMLSGMPGHVFRTPPPGEWFPVKITAVPTAGQYTFDEWWLNGDGTWVVKVGGRVGTTLNYGVALTGTFAVNDYAWARAGAGAGGSLFEMLPVASAGGSGYTTVQEEGVSLAQRATLNFIGSGVTAADSGGTKTNVTVHNAGRTQNGTVTQFDQTFSGVKKFYEDTTSDWYAEINSPFSGGVAALAAYFGAGAGGSTVCSGLGVCIYPEDSVNGGKVTFQFELGTLGQWEVEYDGTDLRTIMPLLQLTTPLELGSGGTGAGLADPGADRILFWDDSAGTMTWLQLGGGLAISTTTLNVVSAGTYTPTNVTTDRSYDADATTVDELADVLGTLIADLQAKGYLS